MAFPNAGLRGSLSHSGTERESWGGHEKDKANEGLTQHPKIAMIR